MASIKQAGSEDGRVSQPSSSQFITGITALWCLGLFIGTRRNSLTYLGLQIAGTDLAVGAGRLFSTVQEIDWVGHVGSAPTMLSKTTSQTTSSGTLSAAGVCGKTGSTTGASATTRPGETRTKRTISGGVIRVRSDDEVSVAESVPGVPMYDLTAEIDLDLTDLVGSEIDVEAPANEAPNARTAAERVQAYRLRPTTVPGGAWLRVRLIPAGTAPPARRASSSQPGLPSAGRVRKAGPGERTRSRTLAPSA